MKFKIKTIKTIAIALMAFPVVLSSCSEDAMDAVNENPNNPTDVRAKFLLADLITSTAFYNVGGDMNTYLSSYVEHEVGTFNQLWDAEQRQSQPALASTFNNPWGSLYSSLRHAQIMIAKCSDGGSEAGNYTTLGMAQVMAAYNLALLTDMFGDVPYSEAMDLSITKTPQLDKQEALYAEIFALLDDALINLPKGDRQSAASHDLLYGGHAGKWIKFAHGLQARYQMRLLHVAPNKQEVLQQVLSHVAQSFAAASEEAAFQVYNAQNLNPFFDFFWSTFSLAASRSMADKMIDRADPRLSRVFTNVAWEQIQTLEKGDANYLLLGENGKNQPIQDYYSTSTFVFAQTAATQLLSYHEVLFLKAEAMQRLGMSSAEVAAVLSAAVHAGIANAEKSVQAAFVAPTVSYYGGITETSAALQTVQVEDYLRQSVLPLFGQDPLKEIATQKYMAFFGASGESTEMYNDIRRWKALGEDLIVLKNPNKFPLRLPYGNSETTTNPHVQAAFGDGQYVYREQVWWAGGSR